MKYILTVCIGSYLGLCGNVINAQTDTLEDCQRMRMEIVESAKSEDNFAYCRKLPEKREAEK